MKKTFARWLQDGWYKDYYLTVWLVPFSLFYVDAVRLRRFFYRHGLKKSVKLPVPVIIVGNITVGGTGKTPLVIWLQNYLREQGFKPGIISRGYGGEMHEQPLLVSKDDNPAKVGDESVLIAGNVDAPLVVCADRVAAGRYLLDNHDCDIIISDDGLQHYKLQRDLEIVVIDGQRRFGNRYSLPAGPLREPIERVHEADLAIVNGVAEEDHEFSMHLSGDTAINLKTQERQPLSYFANFDCCHAIAGIGNPDRFFKLLRDHELEIDQRAFQDHYHFRPEDVDFGDQLPVLMTEKDAVKCIGFAEQHFWYVPVQAKPQPVFVHKLQQLINLFKK